MKRLSQAQGGFMKSVKSIAIKASMLAAMTVMASAAQAATWVDVGPASGFVIASSTVTYAPSPALQVKYYDANLVPQDPAAIQGYINGVFGSSLGAAVSYCDNATSGCTAGTTVTVAGLPKDLSNYRAFISAVPEPETYAMLLAGLGMLGFLARRRQGE